MTAQVSSPTGPSEDGEEEEDDEGDTSIHSTSDDDDDAAVREGDASSASSATAADARRRACVRAIVGPFPSARPRPHHDAEGSSSLLDGRRLPAFPAFPAQAQTLQRMD